MRDKILPLADKAIYWEIIFIPFVASFSSAAVNVFIGLLLATFIFKRILSRNISIVRTPINIPFAILFMISLASIFNSVNIPSSLQGIVKLIKYGSLLLILATEIKDDEHIKKIITATLFGLLLASLDGIYQLIFGVDFFRHKPYDTIIGLARLKAAFPHTNIFAGYLALFVPISLVLFLYHSKDKKKILLGIVSVLGLFCLIFTFCRSAIFGVWLVIFLMGIIKKDKAVIVMAILAVIIAPFLVPSSIKTWAKTTTSLGEFLLNKERFPLYETSLNMIKHHPVMGVGVNTYALNYQKYKLHNISPGINDTMWYAHNSFLQMGGEIGITGLLIFFWLLYLLFSKGIKFSLKTKDAFLSSCSLGIIMGILAFLINGLTETNLYYPKIATLFWFEAGLLMAILRLRED